MSLTSLLKRSTRFTILNGTGFAQTPTGIGQWAILPYVMGHASTPSGAYKALSVNADWYVLVNAMFAMSRGGIRWKQYPTDAASRGSIIFVQTGPIDPTYVPNGDTINYGYPLLQNFDSEGQLGAIFDQSHAPLEIEFPQYGRFHSRLNQELMVGSATIPYDITSLTVPDQGAYCQYNNGNQSLYPIIQRGVADDFQTGYFVGVPPMLSYTQR